MVSKVYSIAANEFIYLSGYILCDHVVGDGPVEGPHLLALQDVGGGRRVEAVVAAQLDRRRVLDASRAVAPVNANAGGRVDGRPDIADDIAVVSVRRGERVARPREDGQLVVIVGVGLRAISPGEEYHGGRGVDVLKEHHVLVVGQDEVLEVGDFDLGGRPRAAVRVRAGVAALAHAAVLEVPVPVGVGADADAALVGRPRLPPEAVGLGVLVTVGVGDRKDVPV